MKLYNYLTPLLILSATSAFAVDNNWTGATSTDWNDASNWSDPHGLGANHLPERDGLHPPDEHAVINTLTNFPVIVSNTLATPADTIVGIAGNTGRIDHLAGVHNSGSANWSFIGRDSGNGTYNLADTTGAGGTATGFAMGAGTFNAGDRLYVGSVGGSTGVFNLNTSGQLNVNQEIQIGDASGVGTLNFDNGTLNNGSLASFGNNGMATVNMTGGTWNNGGELWVGQGAAGNGNLNISGGSVTAGNWIAIGREGSTGEVNLTGSGSLEMTGVIDPNAQITVGTGDGGNGTINVSDNATLTSTKMILGENTPTSVGLVNQSGGVVMISDTLDLQGGGVGTYNLVGGTLQATNIEGSNGTLDMTGNGRLQGVAVFTGDLTQAGGTVAPGSMAAATMLVTGSFDQGALGILEIDVTGALAGEYDVLQVTGDVSLLGNLDVIASTGLSTGDILTIIDNTGVNPLTGTFANHLVTGSVFFEDGYQWQIDYGVGTDSNDVTLTVLGIPEPSGIALLSLSLLAMFRRRR